MGSLSSRIELSIACDNLRNMDFGIGNKSDPFVVVYLHRNNEWQEIGRTVRGLRTTIRCNNKFIASHSTCLVLAHQEIIANQLNPRFVKLIPMMYNFEEVQLLGFKVYDVDTSFTSNSSESIDLSKQDYLGECMCYLAEIMGGAGQTRTMALTDRGQTVQGWGTLTVTAEEMSNQNAIVRLRMRATGLPKMDFFGKADPFLIFNRLKEDRQGVKKVPCFKTEVKLRTYNPAWDVIEVNIQRLCNGDLYRPILIECYDWDSDGSHDYIGERQVSLNEILGIVTPEAKTARRNELALVHKDKPRSTHSYGSLIFEECAIIPKPTFLDYIAGGCQMNFMVAIDFTASNGDPGTPGTLHYIDPTGHQLNQYQQAILAVGDVLQYYDTDKRYPLWGFGGKPVPGEPANHCFALNGYEDNPEVEGIHGILAAYSHAVQHVQLAGPTLFANVIGTAAAIAASAESQITQAQQQYFVLLILTGTFASLAGASGCPDVADYWCCCLPDGIINDMDNTISQIVYAANLPLSILIVGVGDADFRAMEVLVSCESLSHSR